MTLKLCKDCRESYMSEGRRQCRAPELLETFQDPVEGNVPTIPDQVMDCRYQREAPDPMANVVPILAIIQRCGREGHWFKALGVEDQVNAAFDVKCGGLGGTAFKEAKGLEITAQMVAAGRAAVEALGPYPADSDIVRAAFVAMRKLEPRQQVTREMVKRSQVACCAASPSGVEWVFNDSDMYEICKAVLALLP
ncbi:MAG: hypothetical protein KGL39_06705 [Patescibacteria group bacterium]|nr:hypothetical protein [Patescibacteria group bacterium]